MQFSCALATSKHSPEQAAIAEDLGYRHAFFYDSPALYPDVWMQLSRAAERTERIGLGPGVLVPSLRHPLTTAAAIATLVDAVGPERVVVGVGSGFTARVAMGQRPLRWAYVSAYVATVQKLLRGEVVDWEGGRIQMLHTPGYAPPRPIEVRFLLGVGGPKGLATANQLGTGLFIADGAGLLASEGKDRRGGARDVVKLVTGTVLDPGEPPTSDRARDAAGHAAAVRVHYGYELGSLEDSEWTCRYRTAYEAIPVEDRHLAMHRGHLVTINETDAAFIDGEKVAELGYAKTASEWRRRFARWEQAGVTEVAYQPAGPDIRRELEAFAAAAGG
jgi:5,10-methylenetetrahydromethanopterin reductase